MRRKTTNKRTLSSGRMVEYEKEEREINGKTEREGVLVIERKKQKYWVWRSRGQRTKSKYES